MRDHERKYREIQEEKEQAKERQARDHEEDEKKRQEEEQQQKRRGPLERYDGVTKSMIDILGQNPHFNGDERLTKEEIKALELMHHVKVGENEEGTPANARVRRLLLNQALAALQPILSLAHDPRLRAQLMSSYKKVQTGVKQLHEELKTAQLMEMHSGKGTLEKAAKAPEGEEPKDAEKAALAELAWELIQLWKKRKKKRFRWGLRKNPVGNAIQATVERAAAVAEAAATFARASEKLNQKKGAEAKRALREAWEVAAAELIAAVNDFFAACDEGAGDPASVGAYPRSLLPRFAPLVAQFGEVTDVREAIAAATAIVEQVSWCAAHQDELVAAEAEQ